MESEERRTLSKYERILYCEYPFSLCRKRSSLSHRAVQFFSFAALKGYEEMIEIEEGEENHAISEH